LTRISAYLKAHPEANTLADGMAPAEASPAKLMVAPDAARKNARSPGGPGGSPLQNMLSTLDELNIALNEFINPTTIPTGSKSPIMGDLGGLRKTLIDDLVQANADVLAGINYANGSDVPPATPAPAVQPTKAGVTEDDSGNGARLPSAIAGLALSEESAGTTLTASILLR
jgi:hypothetical protein